MRRLLFPAFVALLTIGCDTDKNDDDDDDGLSDGLGDDGDDGAAVQCEAPSNSVCGDEGSLVRGTVTLDPDLVLDDTTGDLFVALTHYRLGSGNQGGYYHMHTVVEDIDLADGAASFELDMCGGSAMWSEDNCEYNLIVALDQDGDMSYSSLLPDEGEPATRVAGVELSCGDESPCYEVVLDCVDGQSCVTFDDPGACTCAEETCNSDYATCQ